MRTENLQHFYIYSLHSLEEKTEPYKNMARGRGLAIKSCSSLRAVPGERVNWFCCDTLGPWHGVETTRFLYKVLQGCVFPTALLGHNKLRLMCRDP